jgi:hypothetical protein
MKRNVSRFIPVLLLSLSLSVEMVMAQAPVDLDDITMTVVEDKAFDARQLGRPDVNAIRAFMEAEKNSLPAGGLNKFQQLPGSKLPSANGQSPVSSGNTPPARSQGANIAPQVDVRGDVSGRGDLPNGIGRNLPANIDRPVQREVPSRPSVERAGARDLIDRPGSAPQFDRPPRPDRGEQEKGP